MIANVSSMATDTKINNNTSVQLQTISYSVLHGALAMAVGTANVRHSMHRSP